MSTRKVTLWMIEEVQTLLSLVADEKIQRELVLIDKYLASQILVRCKEYKQSVGILDILWSFFNF